MVILTTFLTFRFDSHFSRSLWSSNIRRPPGSRILSLLSSHVVTISPLCRITMKLEHWETIQAPRSLLSPFSSHLVITPSHSHSAGLPRSSNVGRSSRSRILSLSFPTPLNSQRRRECWEAVSPGTALYQFLSFVVVVPTACISLLFFLLSHSAGQLKGVRVSGGYPGSALFHVSLI